uniref:WD_REPEATS_REGION domain-containing protein n=1 Tax=Mesocestoides corti TaxID=53468 RepID=A0A5K3FLX9_MESCO
MFVSKSVHSNHADLIHDVAYDYYGRRMATCSSDQMIKIWDLRDDQEWECTARWRYHLGSVWRVCWAHPEFGQIIATCSFDRTIAIWEEIMGYEVASTASAGGDPSTSSDPQQTAGSTGTSNTRGGVWIRRAHLVDPRNSVTGLMFAPRFLGLQLAAISTDGVLLVYEAQDVMNLCQWTVQCDFATKMAGSCLAWSQSRLDPPLIAAGSASLIDSHQRTQGDLGELSGSHPASHESGAASNHGKLVLLEYNEGSRRWNLVQDVVGIKDFVYDVAFAPSMGQSYQTLAVGSDVLMILCVKSVGAPQALTGNEGKLSGTYNVSVMARFDQHGGRVSRVAWNFQGNILASAGDDGTVRLWCSNYLKTWFPFSVIRPGEASLPISPSSFGAAAALSQRQAAQRAAAPPSLAPSASASLLREGAAAVADGHTTGQLTAVASDVSVQSAASAENRKPVRFKKSGSVVSSKNQVVWH